MSTKLKFGRRLNMPPTTVIKHQLRMMAATDSLVSSLMEGNESPEGLISNIAALMRDYDLSFERANMLMDRMGLERRLLKKNEAAPTLA